MVFCCNFSNCSWSFICSQYNYVGWAFAKFQTSFMFPLRNSDMPRGGHVMLTRTLMRKGFTCPYILCSPLLNSDKAKVRSGKNYVPACLQVLLGAFAKFRKELYVRRSISLFAWNKSVLTKHDFEKNSFLNFFPKSAEKNNFSPKSDKNNWPFTWRRFPIYDISLNYFKNVRCLR